MIGPVLWNVSWLSQFPQGRTQLFEVWGVLSSHRIYIYIYIYILQLVVQIMFTIISNKCYNQ